MRDPEISFSPWTRRSERASLPGIGAPGIYALAKFEAAPPGPADPRAQQVIYIGETCASLRRRWAFFNGSAFEGKSGHSGGKIYQQEYGDDGADLYVTALPVDSVREQTRPFYIRYVERKLIWEYVETWGGAPSCNRR